MIVEDESIVALEIKDRIISLGYEVVNVVSSGEIAIIKAGESKPDLILMDIMIKGSMDGIETAKKIREKYDIPAIFLTAYSDEKTIQRAKISEPYGYLLKPLQERELRTTIEMALYKHRTEQALKQSQKWLSTILNSIGDAVIATDAEERIRFINPVAETITNWKQQEVLGEKFSEVYRVRNEITNEVIENPATRVIREGITVGMANHTVLLTKDDCKIPVEDTASPICDENGEIIGVVIIFHDVSERRRKEEQIRKLSSAVEQSPSVVVITNFAGDIEYVNPKFTKLTGYEFEEVKYKNSRILKSGKTDPVIYEVLWESITAGHEWRGELQNKKKNGEFYWESISISPLRDSENKITHFIAVKEDITQRKHAEEATRRAEIALAAEKERLAVTLRSIGDAVISTDTEAGIVLVNREAEKLTGYEQHEILGKNFTEVFELINEMTGEPFDDPIEKVLTNGGIIEQTHQVALMTKDNIQRCIAYNASPLRDSKSTIIGAVMVFRDITEQIKMEEELRRAQKLDSLSLLAGGIAHDFNNILTAIAGNLSLAKINLQPTEKIYQRVSQAENATLRAQDLTQQLLTFAKGGAPIKKMASLGEMVKDVTSFVLRGSNVKCEYYIQENLWSAEVDIGQMSQVLNNLVINATQAMPDGGTVKISGKNVTIDDSINDNGNTFNKGNYIQISVQDNGIGISSKHLPKIFDPFFTTKQKGSGLGLASCYSIIKNHEGHIKVESEIGKGTTFSIYLPAIKIQPTEKPSDNAITLEGNGRILVMDDDEFVLEIVGDMLKEIGYQVEFAKNGQEAIDLYTSAKEGGKPFKSVIMDLTIPGGMGGRETIEKLTEIDPDVKAVVSSGYSSDPIMGNFREYGFRGCVSKPYRVEDICKTLNEIIMEEN
jgi:PAS domain S-box-containing protein